MIPLIKKKPKKAAGSYTCSHCDRVFHQESSFLDHCCMQMQRAQQMKTTEGMAAWLSYSTWLKFMGKKVPPQTGFISSKFYQSFVKFAGFVKDTKLPNVDSYIRHMVKHDIPPVIWTHSSMYEEWVRVNSAERSPAKLVQTSAIFLCKVAEEQQVDVADVFVNTTSGEISQWIRNGDVSPWLLLTSTKFKQWFQQLDELDRDNMAKVLDVEEWMDKIRANPNTIAKTKAIVAELGL